MTHHDDTAGTMRNPHHDEAKARWGHTEAWRQSQERVAKMTPADMERVKREGDLLMRAFVAAMEAGAQPGSADVLPLVDRHYEGLRAFYDPNPQMYRGLADVYVQDARFTATFDRYKPGLAAYLRDAIHAWCDAKEGKTL
jgi:hypothetical protein